MLTKGFTVCISPLRLLEIKEKGAIVYLKNQHETIIKKLTEMGLLSGVNITLEKKSPSFIITVGETRLDLDQEIADSIYIRLI